MLGAEEDLQVAEHVADDPAEHQHPGYGHDRLLADGRAVETPDPRHMTDRINVRHTTEVIVVTVASGTPLLTSDARSCKGRSSCGPARERAARSSRRLP